jgi:hypothetical protein
LERPPLTHIFIAVPERELGQPIHLYWFTVNETAG